MLRPDQIDRYPDRLVALYAEAEADIIADMARRIATFDDFIPAAEWQFRKLWEMGNLQEEILKKLSQATKKSKQELKKLMQDAGIEALNADDAVYRKAGLEPEPLARSPALQAVLLEGLNRTGQLFENLTKTTANTVTKQFENALDRAWLQIMSGAFSHTEAVRMAVKDLSQKGIASVIYPSGHIDYLDVAVRRATLTGINQTALKLQDARAIEMNSDLVEVSAHAGARNTGAGPQNHASWQGKIYSRSGTHPKYPSLVEKTGYGTGAGLGGWNCRHNMYPFIEGVSKPLYSQNDLEEMNTPQYKYNGEMLTAYEATEKQRAIERNIRKYKREFMGMKAAGLPTDEAAARLAKWQRVQTDFLEQTGLKRQYARQEVVGFGRSEAARATWAARKAPLPKTVSAPDSILQVTFGDTRIRGVIPHGTELTNVRIIAGAKTSTQLRHAEKLVQRYGGAALNWQKKGGIIQGKYHRYDIHWEELDGKQYDVKLKGVKPE